MTSAGDMFGYQEVELVWKSRNEFHVKLGDGATFSLAFDHFMWSKLSTDLEDKTNSLDKQVVKIVDKRNKAGTHILVNCHCTPFDTTQTDGTLIHTIT